MPDISEQQGSSPQRTPESKAGLSLEFDLSARVEQLRREHVEQEGKRSVEDGEGVIVDALLRLLACCSDEVHTFRSTPLRPRTSLFEVTVEFVSGVLSALTPRGVHVFSLG
jgi:hypothetical protein